MSQWMEGFRNSGSEGSSEDELHSNRMHRKTVGRHEQREAAAAAWAAAATAWAAAAAAAAQKSDRMA